MKVVCLMSALAVATAECTRELLVADANRYITAQNTGSTAELRLSRNFTYRENNKIIDIKTGVLSKALVFDTNRSTADLSACASYTMSITTGSPPYVIATQIHHDPYNISEITLIDTIAATTGSLFFDAKKTLGLVNTEDWRPLPEKDRPSRDMLQRVVDAYLDMWTDKAAADTIPWGTECERVEGSRLTRPCGASLPHGGSKEKNSMRRYVIDEVMGSVDVLCAFNSLGNMPDSHEIRIEDGKVKYVHTITV